MGNGRDHLIRGQVQRGRRLFSPDKRLVKIYLEATRHRRDPRSLRGRFANLYLTQTFPKDAAASLSASMAIPDMHRP